MASIGKDKDGRKRILFVDTDGKRKTIRLGKCTIRNAESFRFRIENLISCKKLGRQPDIDDIAWLDELPDETYDRLAKLGLVRSKDKKVLPTVSEWITDYIKGRGKLKPSTIRNMELSARDLYGFWDKDRLVTDFTPHDADKLRVYMQSRGLAEATIRRRCKRIKQFFTGAVKSKLIAENPLNDIPTAGRANKKRQYFVTREEICQVIEACPNAQWRLIFALSRFGGLRIISELVGLTWGDILWDKNRFIVHSPKIEHIEGKETRIVPIFPELEPYLRQVFEQAEPGQKKIITMYNFNKNSNLELKRAE